MHTSGLTPAVLTLSCAMLAGSALTVAAPDAETAPVTVTPPVFRTENALSSAEVEILRNASYRAESCFMRSSMVCQCF